MGGPIFDFINALASGNFMAALATLGAMAVLLFICFPIHEYAHAWAANKLGDDTAERMGRLTINPFVHLDLVGSLLLLAFGFGWAKPVPVNTYRLNGNPKVAFALVALAGPVSNILLAIGFGFVYQLIKTSDIILLEYLCIIAVRINLFLAFFNLIPVPPLDGSRILAAVLPDSMSDILHQIERYGFIILILAMNTGIFSGLVSAPANFFTRLLLS
ncbi:MAG: site-2 protease family protein [Anaerolineae bacterium]|nr:site-2 protease family protein [Anaerolineae bacterium]